MKSQSSIGIPKPTSYAYGEKYQLEQVVKHRSRADNHWRPRIALAHELIDRYVINSLGNPKPEEVETLDVGCSIGTMAIEMALRGFKATGVDFDAAALNIGRDLAVEEGVSVNFVRADIAELEIVRTRFIDIAICFDIFEHLHDDELGAMLQAIRRQLSKRGALIFYTFPLQFDYLFFSRNWLHWPLVPFKWLPSSIFDRIARAYAGLLDLYLLLVTGQSYRDSIKKHSHCNPTTKARLIDILERAGYLIKFIESGNVVNFKPHILQRFNRQPIAHRSLYGVAYAADQGRSEIA
ncbi:MAG: class I SAM-dependent methyltransferase [Betaproteobacteria bacterium]|nr:class I SAM-dependent methyltransferase [Betaproteobacteria bacterium]